MLGLAATMTAVAVPEASSALDSYRTAGAASYLAARLGRVRLEAVTRAVHVGLRFSTSADGRYSFAVVVDGNGDGIRSRDIQRGVDTELGAGERLADTFPGTDFGALPDVPAVDPASPPPGTDPIRLGSGNVISYSPFGTSSSGTVYLHGRDEQYAVRVFGETGRVRVFRYDARRGRWTQS